MGVTLRSSRSFRSGHKQEDSPPSDGRGGLHWSDLKFSHLQPHARPIPAGSFQDSSVGTRGGFPADRQEWTSREHPNCGVAPIEELCAIAESEP